MEAQLDELRRVVLEIYECLKEGAITPTFQKLVDVYKQELEEEKPPRKQDIASATYPKK